MKIKQGDTVAYSFYGKKEVAKVIKASGSIVALDNGRWMHASGCKKVG